MAKSRIRKDSLFLTDLPMYGEKRLGVIKENRFLMKKPTQNGIATPMTVTASKPPAKTSIYPLGKKHYESTDRLGNVRVTYTDKKSWNNGKFSLNVSSSLDYYPFGSVMEGRDLEITNYRFGFQGQEGDDEIKGIGNSYDFRARIYDTRLGRWLAVDPQQAKYPGYSPYHFGYCDPIIVIDPNGEENIVVVGNQGSSPKSDKKADGSYRYGKNRRHFLEAGLNEALRLKNESTQNGEATTLIIYQGADPAIKPYTVEEIEYITKKAAAEGINVVVVNDVDEIVDYVNYKSTEPGFFDFGENRKADLITDFSFVGHGEPDNLLVGHNDYDDMGNLRGVWNDFWSSLDLSEFDEESFDIGCRINLIACGSGLGDVFENAQKLTGGSVSGYNTTVWWREGGLGTFRAFEKKYVPFTDPDGRNDPNRPILPENERTRTERGIRTK
ncbi:MAG: hypothetical protein KatS3mg035_2235 [Bacteroidia bacterium]|nr:MAG: hypothetical protein KatS3mg035_2235 [Bacteroidia bacterium]